MRWRAAGEGGGFVEVELIDVDETGAVLVDPRGGARRDPAPRPPRRDRHGLWSVGRGVGLGVVVAVAVGVVAINVAEMRRDADLRAALADSPGYLDPLGQSVAVMWTASDARPVGAAGGAIVVSGASLHAVAAASGDVLWGRPVSVGGRTETCVPADLPQAPDVVVCMTADGPADATLDVVVSAAAAADADVQSYEVVVADAGPSAVASTVLDAATGAELLTVRHPGVLLDATVVDEDMVTVLAQPDGTLLVARWSLVSGAERWTYRSRAGVIPPSGRGVQFLRWGNEELVFGADLALAVDLDTGEQTSPPSADLARLAWTESVTLADGATATWRAGLDFFGIPFRDGVVRSADGSVRFALPAPAWMTEIDDRSVPGVLLVLSTDAMAQLQGLDALTGDVLWTSDVPVRQALARVDGVALVRDGAAVVAVRITDGRELWRVVTEQRRDLEVLTDGDAIALVRQDDTGRFLAGHRVRDGLEVWREALPGGAWATAQGGRLLVVGRFGVTALG